MAPVLNAAAAMALAGSASAFVAPSAFNGAAVSSKAAGSSTKLSMAAVDTGINGFGRIGRLVARSMVKNPETNLKLINTGAAPEYMAYQVRRLFACMFWRFAAFRAMFLRGMFTRDGQERPACVSRMDTRKLECCGAIDL